MKHIMLDLETLGTRNNSVIAVIAAVYFDIRTGKTGPKFYRLVDVESCRSYNLKVEAETLRWWNNQSEEAKKEVFSISHRISLPLALRRFSEFIEEDICIWGNSARFDCGLLEDAYYAVGLPIPWKHWNERDVRTLSSFAPEIKENTIREGTHHNALDDCYHQIKYCSAIYQKIMK